MQHHHFEQSVGSWQELSHHSLEQCLAFEILLVGRELDLELGQESVNFLLLEIHARLEDAEDWVQTELVESTLDTLALVLSALCPFLSVWVEVAVTPKTLCHLLLVDTEFLGVLGSELTDSEKPIREDRNRKPRYPCWGRPGHHQEPCQSR